MWPSSEYTASYMYTTPYIFIARSLVVLNLIVTSAKATNNYLLPSRELELSSSQSFNSSCFVCILCPHRHNDLSNVNTCHSTLRFAKGTTHTSLKPEKTVTRFTVLHKFNATWNQNLQGNILFCYFCTTIGKNGGHWNRTLFLLERIMVSCTTSHTQSNVS